MFRFLSQFAPSKFELPLLVTTADKIMVILRKLVLSEQAIQKAVNTILDCINKLEQYFDRDKTNEYTQTIADHDTARDDAFRALYNIVYGLTRKKNTEISEPAKQILSLIDSYGATLYQENYARESFLLNSLLKDLQDPKMQDAITKADVGEEVEELSAAQKDFENVTNEKIQSVSNDNSPKILDIKKDLIYNINAILSYVDLNANYDIEPYKGVVSQLNEVIGDSMKLFRSSQTRKENSNQNDIKNPGSTQKDTKEESIDQKTEN